MKATELKKIYDQLSPAKQSTVEQHLKDHIIAALAYFYEEAQVGDNPLELEHPITYGDQGYEITGIEMMFDETPKGAMVFHQNVERGPLESLTIETLLSVMKAYEEQGFDYDEAFDFNSKKQSV